MAKKSNITTVFFGLDGVIVNTDACYDNFWNSVAEKMEIKIDNFASVVKGMTINAVIELYFTILSREEKQSIRDACAEMEQSINYNEIIIPGVIDYINYLKKENYKLGLVTSSATSKVGTALNQLRISRMFDTIITADSIKRGKPDPMGYVLAQTNLGVDNTECAVFEDAFTGIKAATYAFMRVIGVATSLSPEFLKDYTYGVIKDFNNLEELKQFLS